MNKKAWLILENGSEFEGNSFGSIHESFGEIVINTSMSGYQELLTSPSCSKQIIAMTYPTIGNYGVNDTDSESDKIHAIGLIVSEYSKTHSNFRAVKSLQDYLKEEKIAAIENIDTRKLTNLIREKGTMRAGIFFDKDNSVDRLKSIQFDNIDLASQVSCKEKYRFGESKSSNIELAVFDFGVNRSLLNFLSNSQFNITVYPSNTPLHEVINDGAKGIFLSNGPGNPEAIPYAMALVNDIMKEKIPCFGIDLGHLILSMGLGGKTYKLKFGHRGANHPVKNTETGNVEITCQNHGFAVDADSIKSNSDVEVTHINLNDNTIEGIKHKILPVFSVQYLPQSDDWHNETHYLFDKFKKGLNCPQISAD
jgi:carbamoyl-phosphate synthase small subunit